MHLSGKSGVVFLGDKKIQNSWWDSCNCLIIQLTVTIPTLYADNMWYVSQLWFVQWDQSCEVFWGETRWSWHPLIINGVNYHSINQLWPLLKELPMLREINTHFPASCCIQLITLTYRQNKNNTVSYKTMGINHHYSWWTKQGINKR